jgi:hypothetical protein
MEALLKIASDLDKMADLIEGQEKVAYEENNKKEEEKKEEELKQKEADLKKREELLAPIKEKLASDHSEDAINEKLANTPVEALELMYQSLGNKEASDESWGSVENIRSEGKGNTCSGYSDPIAAFALS